MPAQISFKLKGAILAFHSLKMSMRKIVHQLLVMGKTIALSTVHSIITQKIGRIQDVLNHQKGWRPTKEHQLSLKAS
jgi:hypothetical protein